MYYAKQKAGLKGTPSILCYDIAPCQPAAEIKFWAMSRAERGETGERGLSVGVWAAPRVVTAPSGPIPRCTSLHVYYTSR